MKRLLLFLLFAVPTFAQNPVINDPANGLTQTFSSGAAIIPGQIVKLNGTGQVIPVTVSDTSSPIGIAATGTNSAYQTIIVTIGGSRTILVDGACTIGQKVQISAITAGYGNCSSSPTLGTVGLALAAVSAAGQVSVQLQIGGSSSSGGGGGANPYTNGVVISTNCNGAANCFGITGNTIYISDPTFTNTSQTVSLPNADYTFTAAMNGRTCWGTNATTDVSTISSTVIMGEATWTTLTASTGTCNFPGGATATTSASGFLVIGTPDTPLNGAGGTDQIAAASTAAANACSALFLPAATIMIEQVNDIANTGPANGFCNQNSAVNTRKGLPVIGTGSTSTVIIVNPNTKGTNCTGPNGTGPGCYLSFPNVYATGFELTCLGNSAMDSTFNNKSLFYMSGVPINGGSNFKVYDVIGLGCAGTNTGTIGLNIGNNVANSISGGMITQSIFEAFGMTTVSYQPGIAASVMECTQCWIVVPGNSGSALSMNNGFWSSGQSLYGYTNSTTTNAVVINGGTASFSGDDFPYNTGAGVAQLLCGGSSTAATCLLDNTRIVTPTTNGYGLAVGGGQAGSIVHAHGSTITSVTNNRSLLLNSSELFFDDCGNTIGTSTINGSVFGSCSVVGNIPATGNFALTNATFTSEAGTDSKHFTLTITASANAAVTVVYTYPVGSNAFTTFLAAPGSCHAVQTGGTNPILTWSTSVAPTTTAVTFLSTAAATNTDTIILNIDCQ